MKKVLEITKSEAEGELARFHDFTEVRWVDEPPMPKTISLNDALAVAVRYTSSHPDNKILAIKSVRDAFRSGPDSGSSVGLADTKWFVEEVRRLMGLKP